MMRRQPAESTAAVLSVLLHMMSWGLTAALLAGRWLFGPDWPGPFREWAALGVSVALTVYHVAWGRRLIRSHHDRPLGAPAGQAAAITVVVVAAGVFATWLFVPPRV